MAGERALREKLNQAGKAWILCTLILLRIAIFEVRNESS